jgi:hypothetical protein
MANQRRGYETERKCFFELESRGFLAFRSAASRGPYDIFAVGDGFCLFIQVKRTKHRENRAAPRFVRAMRAAVPEVSEINRKQLWTWVDREGWFVVEIGVEHEFAHWGLPDCVLSKRRELELTA